MAKYKILSTKKLLPSLVRMAEEHHLRIVEQEAISVRPVLTDAAFKRSVSFLSAEHVVFTSGNAVSAVDKYLQSTEQVPDWRIFCLSGATRQTILESSLHLNKIMGEAGNATALARVIIASGIREIIFFCGNRRRDEVPVLLKNAGITVHELTVYETIATPLAAEGEIDAVLFFSPSAVESFFSINRPVEGTIFFAIGGTTAASLAQYTTGKIITSKAPDQESMLESVKQYYKNQEDVKSGKN